MIISLTDFAEQMRQASQSLLPRLLAEEAESLDEVEREALSLSQGSFTTKQLRQMGHPYAKRDPRPPQDKAIINDQGGDFALSWQQDAPRVVGGGIQSGVENLSEEADWLAGGTRTMIARPVAARVAQRLKVRREMRVQKAIAQSLVGSK